MYKRLFFKFILGSVGFLLRYTLLKSPLSESLSNRVEISTPLTSWKKAVEGVDLWRRGINPYDSDIFHESPLGLFTYSYILNNSPNWLPFIFSLTDVLTAMLLSCSASLYLKNMVKKEQLLKVPESTHSLVLKSSDVDWVPFYVAAMYLLCPYSVISCGGKSTVTFQNLLLAMCLFFTVAGQWFAASVILAVLSCHSFYPVVLVVPLLLYIYQEMKTLRLVIAIATFVSAAAITIFTFHSITGSWDFAWNTYGCILSVPDLTPNIGLFWYFFTEMFEHFRVFFICTFQLNVFIYTVPLALRLRKDPIFLLFLHVVIVSVFKSYPCIGDVALYLSLLPMWHHLFYFMRQRFIVCCVVASCTLLAPTLWHLWIYSGSANANFYFAITLAFNTGQVFLLTDLLSAYVKRDYFLQNGVKYNDDGIVPIRLH